MRHTVATLRDTAFWASNSQGGNVEILVFLVLAVVLFGSGYAFRGAIHREVVKLGGELKNEVAALRSDIKAKL